MSSTSLVDWYEQVLILFFSRWPWITSFLAFSCTSLAFQISTGWWKMGRWSSHPSSRGPTPQEHVVGDEAPNLWNPSSVPCIQTLPSVQQLCTGVRWAGLTQLPSKLLWPPGNGGHPMPQILGPATECALCSGKKWFCSTSPEVCK